MGIKLDPDPFNPNEWAQKIIKEVNETEEAFIFTTIKPFVDSVTTMEISKEELVRAVQLVRLQKEASEKFGVSISNDWNTATSQMRDLNEAYMRGVRYGVAKVENKIENILKEL